MFYANDLLDRLIFFSYSRLTVGLKPEGHSETHDVVELRSVNLKENNNTIQCNAMQCNTLLTLSNKNYNENFKSKSFLDH